MSDHELARALLLLTEYGAKISAAIARYSDTGLTRNTSVIVISSLALDGPQRPSDLQDLTGLSSGGVTHLLDHLERSGFITRNRPSRDHDRRTVIVELTADGQRAFSGMVTALEATRTDLEAMLKNITTLIG